MIATLGQDLSQPEYIHVLINPLPVYGLTMGIIGLVIALFQQSRSAQVATLALILLSGAIAWPVVHYGEEGYDRVLSMADDQGQAWLKVHEHWADQLAWSFCPRRRQNPSPRISQRAGSGCPGRTRRTLAGCNI